MKIRITFCLLLIMSVSVTQTKQVCFTIDDLPVVSYGINDPMHQKVITDKLILSLNEYKIPAIGFVNERKLVSNGKLIQFQVNLLKKWVKSGLDLGNHSFSHLDYNSVTFKQFSNDILRGEVQTKIILKKNGKKLKYFRHPFLHVGNTKEKADSLTQFLETNGYSVAPVTVDNDDYIFALAYKRAFETKDSSLMKEIGNQYIAYMEKKVNYFEKQANKLFGRDISQIFLIHASLLNADYVDDLARMFIRNNYQFIDLDKALKDNAYKSEISVFGNWGISWIDRWALSRGEKGDFFKNEPETPDFIKKLAQ